MTTEISKSMRLTLQDLQEGCYENMLSKYLSVSINYIEPDIHISITTTDKEATTFSASVPATTPIDMAALTFEIAPKAQTV